ncbi:MAG: ATP-binding protein [Actinobacteria bacterium]|nr:ATP-binding protein [Actinomycetota bacterium]
MNTRAADAGAIEAARAVELDRARVGFLLPGIRRGFLISAVPIVVLGILLWSADADGATTWVVLRLCLSAVLFAAVVRMGDGLADPTRSLNQLTVVMVIGSVGWGLLPILVDTSDIDAQAVAMFAIIANLAIVTITCAADRRIYLAAAVPAFALGVTGLLVMNGDGPDRLGWLALLALPYSFAIFVTANRTLGDGFDLALRNQTLVDQLEVRQTDLRAMNERLQFATAQQTLLLDERAALIAAVGHDLGSPLGAAMLTAEMLADRHDALPAERHPELARRIHTQVHDAIVVLRDLTSTQRLSETDIEASRTQVDLHDIVSVVVARLREPAGAEQQIRSEVPPESWLWADPALLERILDNLVGNAVKYTPSRSRIDIGCLIVDEPDGPDEPVGASLVWVDDDGPGLAEGMEETVFEPYVRGLATSATSGSGVGLFLVRTFVRLHGGEVWWEPSTRGGSRFVVSLPNRPSDDRGTDDRGTDDRTHGVTADG